jgi:hypothetical protein
MSATVELTREVIMANASDISKINNDEIINKFKKQLYLTEYHKILYSQQVEKGILAHRNPVYVIMRVLDAIPSGILNAGPSSEKAELSTEQVRLKHMYKLLEELIETCIYRPPEIWRQTWEDMATILETFMPNEKKDWIELVQMIVQNKA